LTQTTISNTKKIKAMQKVTKVFLLLAGSALLVSGTFSSCKKSSNNNNNNLPPIGGYNTSNDVAAANLMAHWTFDNTNNEAISSTAPKTVQGASFVTGVKGQALSLNKGYLAFPPTITNLNTVMASFTVSAWIKVKNNGSTVSTVFALTNEPGVQSDWNNGPIEMYVETATSRPDTIDLHTAFASLEGVDWQHGDNINDYDPGDTAFKFVIALPTDWIHYVATYDASTSRIKIYANGNLVSNTNFELRKDASGNLIGNLNYPTPTQVLIGSFANLAVGYTGITTQSWQGLFTGSIDELRVYNKALAASDISALYQLEKAGR